MSSGGEKASDDFVQIARNHKAGRDYDILEAWEVGIQLTGPEIKSIRNRQATLEDSFARIEGGEVFLYNMHVSPYKQAGYAITEPARVRKLLLHREQIKRLEGRMTQKRLTLIPLRLYLKRGLAKLDLALCQGKKLYEKRETLRAREVDRETERTFKDFRRRGDRSHGGE